MMRGISVIDEQVSPGVGDQVNLSDNSLILWAPLIQSWKT